MEHLEEHLVETYEIISCAYNVQFDQSGRRGHSKTLKKD